MGKSKPKKDNGAKSKEYYRELHANARAKKHFGKKDGVTSAWWFRPLVGTIILLAIWAFYTKEYTGFVEDLKKPSSKSKETTRNKEADVETEVKTDGSATSTDDIKEYPTIAEFIELSKNNGVEPYSPIDKLDLTIKNFGRSFEYRYANLTLTNIMRRGIYMNKGLRSDYDALMEVIKRDTTGVQVDLTEHLYTALDSIHESIYTVSKASLGALDDLQYRDDSQDFTGSRRRASDVNMTVNMITRTTAEQLVSDFLYSPIQTLLRLGTRSEAEMKESHITVSLAADSLSPLRKPHNILTYATKLRLYRLMQVFPALNVPYKHSLHIAVANADDLGIAILCQQGPDLDFKHNGQTALELAQSLGYNHIANRLMKEAAKTDKKDKDGDGSDKEDDNRGILDITDEYAMTTGPVKISTAFLSSGKVKKKEVGGYTDLGVVFKDTLGSNFITPSPYPNSGDNTTTEPKQYRVDPIVINQCQIESLSKQQLSDLSIEQLRNKLQFNNVPVTFSLEEFLSTSEWESLQKAASLSSLLAELSGSKVNTTSIPYGSKFGQTKTLHSFEDFVENHIKGQTTRLNEYISTMNSNKAIVNFTEMAIYNHDNDANLIPEYIFTPHFNDNLKLTNDILEVLQNSYQDDEKKAGVDRLAHLLQTTNKFVFDRSILVFQFILGGPLSGSPAHLHTQALNALIYGRKYWYLLPPSKDVYSNVHPVEFAAIGGLNADMWPYAEDHLRDLGIIIENSTTSVGKGGIGPCQFEQKAGDLLYIPSQWTHSTINVAETVGFALEIHDNKDLIN